MFEAEMQAKLQRIFDFKKVRYEDPSDSLEQECMFIRVENAKCRISEKIARAQVEGDLWVYANSDKLPFGYFAKKIQEAQASDTQKFMFHEVDTNVLVTNNIVRRSVGFVFFYEGQYDPSIGTIETVLIDVETETP